MVSEETKEIRKRLFKRANLDYKGSFVSRLEREELSKNDEKSYTYGFKDGFNSARQLFGELTDRKFEKLLKKQKEIVEEGK